VEDEATEDDARVVKARVNMAFLIQTGSM
jgi:hypothetical protein